MDNETKRCPFCNEKILATAIKCKHCGSMLNQPSPEAPVMLPPSDPVTWVRHALTSRYEILEEIGRGGMAVVYKAMQKNLKLYLKMLPLTDAIAASDGSGSWFTHIEKKKEHK